MKANLLLKTNVDALLRARGQTRKDLAQWCRRSESWISKIFRDPNRSFPLRYLDRMADFFGLVAYQLLQPGITPYTERRSGRERRSGLERRLSHLDRLRAQIREAEPIRTAVAAVAQREAELAREREQRQPIQQPDIRMPKRRRG